VIQMKRSDRYAIHLLFPMAAVTTLLEAFRAACAGEERPIPIEFDRGVVKRKRFDTLVPRDLVIEKSEDEIIVESNGTVFLRLDQDTLTYGSGKLEECLRDGHFSPAELCELQAGDRPEPNDFYCIVTEA
jgi:hypothetical protein